MDRFRQVVNFIEYEGRQRLVIEPGWRHDAVRERLFDAISTYNPSVVVKAGLGDGRLLHEMITGFDFYCVVVEPSLERIRSFMERYGDMRAHEKLKLVNADLHEFPIDYYAADMLVCVDHLDIFNVSRCMDEFRTSLNFEGIVFLAGVMLSDGDMEGVYDDFMRAAFPLHNDYYLEVDLKTFMDLKGFQYIKSQNFRFDRDLDLLMKHLHAFAPGGEDAPAFLNEHRAEFESLYGLDARGVIREPYFTGTFMRRKPDMKDVV